MPIDLIYILISVFLGFTLSLLKPSVRNYILRFFNRSRRRYFRELYSRFQKEDSFERFPKLSLILSSADSNDQENEIIDELELTCNIHIQGSPGSGKSSLIKAFIIDYCTKWDRLFWYKKIPVYIKHSSGNIFDEILNALNKNEYFKNPDLFTKGWFKQQLIKGKFLIFIDDAHNILSDKIRRQKSEIDELIDYRKNKFVLISRDYYSACPFNFTLYEIEDLSNNRELSEQILKTHADEEKFKRIWMELGYGHKSKLLSLYNTPQLLKLLARVYYQEDKLYDNKTLLFRRFFISRHDYEEKKPNESLPLEIKERVLGAVAYSLFAKYQESSYSVPYYAFREIFNQSVIQINDKYGFTINSDSIFNGLLKEGYLIKIDDKIQYEHDQWQEFFTAMEIHHQEYSIKSLLNKNFGDEIALFVSGFYTVIDEINKRNYWRDFWTDVALSDFFLMLKCQNIITRYIDDTQGEFKTSTLDNSNLNLYDSYRELVSYYENLLDFHFPKLKEKFAPNVKKGIGILLEDNKKQIGFWYAYRPITDKYKDKVVIVDSDKYIDANSFHEQEFGAKYFHSYPYSSAVHDPPARFAFNDVKYQLEEIIRSGHLIETETMKKEALFIEAVSLSKMLTGNRNIYNTSVQEVLTISELLLGIKKLKRSKIRYKIEVPESSLSMGGFPKRSKELEDFEIDLIQHVENTGLKPSDILIVPNSDLIDVIKNYRFNSDELTSEHRKFLIERSNSFYQDIYRNYRQVIETNFPTAKYAFKTYSAFQVFLVIQQGKRNDFLGKHVVFFDENKKDVPINVDTITEEDYSQVKNKYYGYSGINYVWSHTLFSRTEPIRNTVYRLINEEYSDLTRRI